MEFLKYLLGAGVEFIKVGIYFCLRESVNAYLTELMNKVADKFLKVVFKKSCLALYGIRNLFAKEKVEVEFI